MADVDVIPADELLRLLGDTIVGANIVNDILVLTTKSGGTINAGNVRGAVGPTPHANNVPFSPTAGVAADNVQGAIVELAGDATTLGTVKADKSQIPNILAGEVRVATTANTPKTQAFTNVFPAGFFSVAPIVLVSSNTTVPQNVFYYSVHTITTRSFSMTALRSTSADTVFSWIAMPAT